MDRRRAFPWQSPVYPTMSPAATRPAPPPEEATRIFKHVAADTVPTATRAVAEHAIRHALTLHGLPPSVVELQWVQRLAPGATRWADDEFRAPHDMGGKTRSDGHDGRQVTIMLRKDLPLQQIAETALHEAYHSVQYLRAPLAMRHDALSEQVEWQAQEFTRSHLRELEGLIDSFRMKRRA